MKLTPFQLRLLADLRDHPEALTVHVAQRIWPDSPGWRRSSNCGPNGSTRGILMAASLGKHLHKLERTGLVWCRSREETRWRPEWRLTEAGRNALIESQKVIRER